MKYVSFFYSFAAVSLVLFSLSCTRSQGLKTEIESFHLEESYPLSTEPEPALSVRIDCDFFRENDAFNMQIAQACITYLPDGGSTPQEIIQKGIEGIVKNYRAWGVSVYKNGKYPIGAANELIVNARIGAPVKNVRSVCISLYEYTGGAHGNSRINYLNFDVFTRRTLVLNDFLKEGSSSKLVELLIKNDRREKPVFKEPYETENFLVRENGLSFFYSPYEIDCYAAGTIEVFVEWSELHSLLKETAPVGY